MIPSSGGPNPLISRLEKHGPLCPAEKQIIERITARTIVFGPRETIVSEGSTPSDSSLILSGFAMCYTHLPDGRRQIMAFHVPGDFADLHSFLLKPANAGVVALTPCRVASVSHKDLKAVTETHPRLTRLLWRTTLVDGAVQRAWMTSLGRMEARERLAHFLCELRDRLGPVGLLKDNGYEMPMTQTDLGDAFGLSTVHVNRVLQELRAQGLIASCGKTLIIRDWERLRAVGQYSPDYLHLDRDAGQD